MNISVIITLYNKEEYINRCIDSVVNQTYDDFEAIIIDDCSTDNSVSVCKEAIQQYEGNIKWRIIQSEKNEGVSMTRNKAINVAKGEYLIFIDGDDAITPTCIESFVKKIELHPSVEMIIGKIESVPHNDYYNTDYFDKLDYIDDNLWVRNHLYGKCSRIPINPVNKLIKKDFLVQHKLFYEPGIYHEDELWMFFVGKKLAKLAFVTDTTYIRYYVPNSIMTSRNYKGHIDSWSIILNKICRNIDNPCMDLQLDHYLFEYLTRYDELKEIGSTTTLNNLFSKCYARNWDLRTAFVLRRMNSATSHVSSFYKDYLTNISKENTLSFIAHILKKEIDFFRVKLAIGRFF